MAVSKRLRFEVLRRDKHTCRYCGGVAPDVVLTVDHVVPTALGGSDEPSNLVAACADCNSGKSSIPPDAPIVEDVKQDALRWARAMEIAVAIMAAKRRDVEAYRDFFIESWDAWEYGPESSKDKLPLPEDWATTLDAFERYGLDTDEVHEAIRTAMTRKNLPPDRVFRYFCGVCWRVLNQRREIAAALVESSSNEEAFDRIGELGF